MESQTDDGLEFALLQRRYDAYRRINQIADDPNREISEALESILATIPSGLQFEGVRLDAFFPEVLFKKEHYKIGNVNELSDLLTVPIEIIDEDVKIIYGDLIIGYEDKEKNLSEAEIGFIKDATATVAALIYNTRKANLDDLAKTYNRNSLRSVIGKIEASALRRTASIQKEVKKHENAETDYECGVGVFMIDVIGFKEINDTYGHSVGDEVIRLIGKTLKEQVRPNDEVVRFGGDEFIVVGIMDEDFTGVVGERFPTQVTYHGFKANGEAINLTVKWSMGASFFVPERGKEKFLGALDLADVSMYHHKKNGSKE